MIRAEPAGPAAARRADARDGRLRRAQGARRGAHAAGDLRDRARQVRHPGFRSERHRLSTEAGDARAFSAGAGARARTREHAGAGQPARASLLQQLSAQPKYLARVALRSAGKISFVERRRRAVRAGRGELRAAASQGVAAPAARAHRHARVFARSGRCSCASTAR